MSAFEFSQEQQTQRHEALPHDSDVEVLTYVSRGFEEYRGFPQAMQALALLQQKRPNLHALIVGADVVAYGAGREDGRSWGDWAKRDLSLDPHAYPLVGFASNRRLSRRVLASSDVHLLPDCSIRTQLEPIGGYGCWLQHCCQ